MIPPASPGAAFDASVQGFPSGLTGTVGVQILNADDGSVVTARTTAGIVESPAGSGIYGVRLVAPIVAGQYLVVWDTGTIGPSTTAEDELLVTSSQVASGLPGPGDLCALADVKAFLGSSDTTFDTQIQALITPASLAIIREAEREFAPASAAVTRRYRWDAGTLLIDLAPYDLRTITSVTLSPEGGSPSVLADSTDYQGSPVTQPHGTFTTLRMSNLLLVRISTTLFRFGYMLVDILGDWGFPTVPADIRQACVVTVASWLRRDIASFGQRDYPGPGGQIAPDAPSVYTLPPAALRMIRPYRRTAGFL